MILLLEDIVKPKVCEGSFTRGSCWGLLDMEHHQVPDASLALEEEQDNGQSRHSSAFFSLEAWSNMGGGGCRYYMWKLRKDG